MPELTTQLESEIKLQVPAVFTLPELIATPASPAVPMPPALVVGPLAVVEPLGTESVPDLAFAATDAATDDAPNDVSPADVPDVVPGIPVDAVEGRALSLRAAYFDTDDLRLARSGATLRHRTGEGEPTWTLKLPANTGVEGDRTEFSIHAPAGTIPADLRGLITAHVRQAALAEVVELATYRHVWKLFDGTGAEVAELVDDLVSVVSDRKVLARFRELEIERRGIDERALEELVRRLEDAGAIRGVFQSKLVHALGPRAMAPPDVPAAGTVRRSDPGAALLAHAFRSSVAKLLAQDAGVRLGSEDAVHQMRVACRRMRSDLRTFAPLLEVDAAEELRVELAWLADELGAARDLEVLRGRLRKTFAADPLSRLDSAAFERLDALLVEREGAAQDRARSAIDEKRYVALLDLAVAFAREPKTTPAADGPAKDVLPPLVAAAVADLDAGVSRLTKRAPDARWHRARIRAKRARYAAEAAAEALGKSAAATGAALAAVQQVLGDHQDAAVAADVVLAIAAEHGQDPGLVLLCGRLAERERTAVRAARASFAKAWKDASAPAVRRWLPAVEPA
jgi:CHAD domain-containing protein